MAWTRLVCLGALGAALVFNFGCVRKAPYDPKTLSIAWENQPRSFDPRYATDANSQYLENLTHCQLVSFDPAGAVMPMLAEKIEWTGKNQLKIKIRDGVKFSDGTDLTAEDVAETYRFFINENLKEPSARKAFSKDVTNIEVQGNSITFTLKKPEAEFVTNLVVGILPAKLARTDGQIEFEQIKGCGPFMVKEKGVTSITLVQNPHYSVSEKPKLESIVIRIVQDESTRYAKLVKGEVDMVQNNLSQDRLKHIAEHNKDLRIVRREGLNTAYLGFNFRDPVVSKPKVRKALDLAIDREVIIKHVFNGYATPASSMLTPSDPILEKSLKKPSLDRERAKKLLDEAGYKDPDGPGGKPRLTLSYKTTNNATRGIIAKEIASQLSSIDVKLEIQTLEWGKFKADVEAGRAQIWALKWVGFKGPDILYFVFSSETIPPNGGNRGWYKNAELDKLLKKGKQTTEFGARKSIYSRAQKMVAKELPYLFLWHEQSYAVLRPEVEDFELYADGRLQSLFKAYKSPVQKLK